MYKAELRCTKCPIICTNQTGRSNLYCNGAIECEYQRATIEWDGLAAQKNEEAPETIDNNDRDSISEKYNELLMAVEDKFDGETRHETALKYIRFAQTIRTAGSSETKPVS